MMRQRNNSLSREQKTGFVLLFVFGILAVSLAVLQMRNNIYGSFVTDFDESQNIGTGEFFEDELTKLQRIDTDKDGINDYEELYFYETSPYIPDTDSDGIDDSVEIANGTDPLCPEGDDCGNFSPEAIPTVDPTNIADDLAENFGDPLDVFDAVGSVEDGVEPTEEVLDPSIILELAEDADAMRQLLAESGSLTEEDLAGISDEVLLDLARELLLEQGIAQ